MQKASVHNHIKRVIFCKISLNVKDRKSASITTRVTMEKYYLAGRSMACHWVMKVISACYIETK